MMPSQYSNPQPVNRKSFALTIAIPRHRRTTSKTSKHPMGCEAQMAWKRIFTPTVFGGRFWPVKYVKLV